MAHPSAHAVPTRISYRGTILGSRQLGQIQRVVDRLGNDQRREDFADAVCKAFAWRRADGRLATASCRLLLARLERRGLLRLPESRRAAGSGRAGKWLGHLAAEPVATLSAEQLVGPLVVRPIVESERFWWRAHMDRYHYLGNCHMVGESLRYVALVGSKAVALLGWAAAALHNKPRDDYLGWDAETRARNLPMVVGNVRFLVLPWVRVKNLASRVLGANLRRLSGDWQQRFGHEVWLAETFVDAQRFAGTCYRAANWICLGQTLGFARKGAGYQQHGRPKTVFVYALDKHARERLCAVGPRRSYHGKERETAMFKLKVSALPLDGKGGLVEVLRRIRDPRMARGKRYGVTFIMTVAVCAVLAGARSISAITQWAKDQSTATLRRMGCRRQSAPSYSTFSRVLGAIDAAAVDRAVGEWLQSHADELQDQGIALDGKTLRGSADSGSKAVHLVSAALHADGTVIAQTRVQDKTNEIKSVEPLLDGRDIHGAVVTGDAMFTQTAIAKYIVEQKGADYLLVVKDNQPTLRQAIESLQMEAFPPRA